MYYTPEQIRTEKNPELEEYRRYLEAKIRSLKMLLKPQWAWLAKLNGEGYLRSVHKLIEQYTQRLDEVCEELEARTELIDTSFLLEYAYSQKIFTIE